jgi:ELWxxDGT repeat protein
MLNFIRRTYGTRTRPAARAGRRRKTPRALAVDVLEDRTAPAAALVRDLNLNTTGSSPANLVDVNGTVFFSAVNNAGNVALYTSRGAAADTTPVREFPSNGLDTPYLANLTDVNGTVFFSVGRSPFGGPTELWATDGTAARTRLVRDLAGDAFAVPNGGPVLVNDHGTAAAGPRARTNSRRTARRSPSSRSNPA